MNAKYRLSAAMICALSASAALAVTPLQTTVTATPGAASVAAVSASATGAGATRTSTGTGTAAPVSVAKFDTANGILVGARVAVQTAVSTTAQVTGTVLASGGGRTVTSDATMTGTVAVAGASFTSGAVSASRSCSGGNCPNSPSNNSGSTPGTISGSTAISQANLADYAGTGTVTFTRSASGSATVVNGSGAISGTALGFFTFGGGTGDRYSVTYDHLNFANPSFAGTGTDRALTLDFGTLVQNSGPVLLNFTLFNLGNANSAALALTGIGREIGNLAFGTNAAPFTGLVGGDSLSFNVSFNPITLGAAGEVFALDLADYVPGGIGTRGYQMKIQTLANVIAAPAVVPEPAVWGMLLAGFGFVGGAMRRRRVPVFAA